MKTLQNFLNILVLGVLVCSVNSYAQNPVHLYSITQNLKSPVKLAMNSSNDIYVSDATMKSIVKYNVTGQYLETFNVACSPLSIAISSSDEVYFGDGETGNINILHTNGSFDVFYTGVDFPSSMTFSPSGLLYIVDSRQHQVIVLDQSGNVAQIIGTNTLIYPTGISYDNKNNRILVAEHGGIGTGFNPVEKIWVFDLQGNVINSFGSHGNGDGKFYRIQGLSINRCGNIFVPEPFQGNISVFDENFNFITRFGDYGELSGQLNVPLDILVDSQDHLWVTSMNNGALEVFDINYILPTSDISTGNFSICAGESAGIPIHFTGTAPWSFTYTVDGLNPVTINGIANADYILNVASGGTIEIVSLNDANASGSCFSGSSIVTLNTPAVPAFSFVTNNLEVSFTNTSSNAVSYLWNFGDGTTSNEINPVHSFPVNGEYNVSLTAMNENCSSTTNTNVTLINVQASSMNINNYISMYPNPTHGFLNIERSSLFKSLITLDIYNITGQLVFSKILLNTDPIIQIDLSGFSNGIYTVNLKSENCIVVKKLILMQ